MYVITGANGQTGSVVANTLLSRGQPVRVVLRRAEQAAAWRDRGADVCIADVSDEASLIKAFVDADAAYLMNPPAYQADDLLASAGQVHQAMINAAQHVGMQRVVPLSSVGAQHASGTGTILTTHDFETRLADSRLQVIVLRAANFIENWAWFVDGAVASGQLPSMFQPLDRALPMVSVRDIGSTAAALLEESGTGIVELHGPEPYSPRDAAAELSRLTGRPIVAVAIPREAWTGNFRAAGYSDSAIAAFCELFDGFNNGRVASQGTHETRHGVVGQGAVFEEMLRDSGHQ